MKGLSSDEYPAWINAMRGQEHVDIQGINTVPVHDKNVYISNENTTEPDWEYDEQADTSSDTIPFGDNENQTNPSSTLQDLLMIRDRRNTPITSVAEIWKSDALQKKWSVHLRKLNPSDIYALSKPPINWDNINPYSGLEEELSDTEMQNKDGTPNIPNNMSDLTAGPTEQTAELCYQLRTRHQSCPGLCKTVRTHIKGVKYVEPNTSSSDSDYTPKSRSKKSTSSCLKEPSKSRLKSQEMIVQSKRQ